MNWTFASHAHTHAGRVAVGKRPAAWGDRYWLEVEAQALTLGRANSGYTVRIEFEDLALVGAVEAHDGSLWIANEHGAMIAPLDKLEAVFEQPPGELEIHVTTTYPLREPNARAAGTVSWLLADDALVNVGRTQLRLDHRHYGLEKGLTVAFVDELAPGRWAALDVPGRARQTLIEPLAPYTVIAKVVKKKLRPVATRVVGVVARSDEITRLVREIADHDSDHDRAVLIDLLADLGEPCAEVFAQLRAGEKVSPAKRRIALGPLDHFFKPVEFHRGLPATAELVKRPPEDIEAIAALLADVRLGMLETMRLGKGAIALYTRIIASRGLLSLRRADAPSFTVLRALKEAGHTQLTHLYDVRFSEPVAVALLAEPAFASVCDLELRIELRFVEALMRRLGDDDYGVLARAPRHLTIVERNGNDVELARIVCAHVNRLANASVAISGVMLARVDGGWGITKPRAASPFVAAAMREMLGLP